MLPDRAGGVDQPGGRGGGVRGKEARGGGGEQGEEEGDIGGGAAPPIVLRSTHCIKLQSCGLLIWTNDYHCFLVMPKSCRNF